MTQTTKKTVAIIGATGVVGRTILSVLEERNFPVGKILPVASDASAGEIVKAFGSRWPVVGIGEIDFDSVDFCFFTAGNRVSSRAIPGALESGCKIIDNTTAFRLDEDVPLVIPEINGNLVRSDTRLVASPNCTASILVMALAPLHAAVGIERVVVTSLQSVSGTGRRALREMMEQVRADLNGGSVAPSVYPKPIAYNCLPQVGEFTESGYSGEEEKVAAETRKILSAPGLKIVPTTVRVPVRVGHAVSVSVQLRGELSLADARLLFAQAPGVEIDDGVPTPLDAAGRDAVLVGRVRLDDTVPNGLLFWAVGDNLRKGAATNCVQIAELMLQAGSG
jgi:aspartate-semialdehyde dehydrogenase